jgi:Tol biopolymer transport system component
LASGVEEMTFTSGTKLGPYEILSAIGAGGMGEVYKGRDTRLNRTVAIKVLPSHFSDNAEMKSRFDREAQTIAGLNHPHICVLYDVGHQDGTDYLVMEYLEGQTLAQRLEKGALPLDEALRIAIEIADALDKAHRQGVVHRDLKPSNVMLTKSGAKLLDFGLAKLRQETQQAPTLSGLPTNADVTAKGTILGTLQYMAPEQLEGEEADARTDIFTFGVLLYEMITGQKAFTGKSQASLMAAILEHDPPAMTTVQPPAPAVLDRFVRVCLAKDSKDRWQTARELQRELNWIRTDSANVNAVVPVPRRGIAWAAWAVAAAAILVALGSWTFAVWNRVTPDARVIRLGVLADAKNSIFGYALAVSPDGRYVAFTASGESGQVLWMRALDELSAKPLSGTEGAVQPFWSPDSKSIAFFANAKLKRVDLAGGTPQTLSDAVSPAGGTWGVDGTILFVSQSGSGIMRIPASGGSPVLMRRPTAPKETLLKWPWLLPDGKHYLYTVLANDAQISGTYVASLDSTETTRINDSTSNTSYANGHILYVHSNTLVAQRFDPDRRTLAGEPMNLFENVRYNTTNGFFQFAASSSGIVAFRAGGATSSQLVWIDRSGHRLSQIGPVGDYLNPELSPDGKRVVLERNGENGNRDIWMLDLARELFTRFTLDPAMEFMPVWSPDGARILYGSNRSGRYDLYTRLANGAGAEELFLHSDLDKGPWSWSRDGQRILFRSLEINGAITMTVLPLSGDRKPVPFYSGSLSIGPISPDGRWVAYVSGESGRSEVYVQSFPAPGGKWQVSTAGGGYPRWRGDGKELFYVTPDQKLMAVPLTMTGSGAAAAVDIGSAKPLFQANFVGGTTTFIGFRQQYDVTPDGQRFLVNLEIGNADSPITVVVNWPSLLKK